MRNCPRLFRGAERSEMLAEQWFVVQTNPQREAFVEARLSDLQPYLPRFKNLKGRIEPLFRNYIFTPQIAEVSMITHTIGVRGLLMAGDHPASIPGAVIAHWRSKERGGIVQLPPPPRFRPGQRLTITRGSLKYRTVIHAGMLGRDREKVLIEMLGQQVSIVVASTDLVPEFRPPPRNRLRKFRETSSWQRRDRLMRSPV
jgi:transcription antitermination factor NusG